MLAIIVAFFIVFTHSGEARVATSQAPTVAACEAQRAEFDAFVRAHADEFRGGALRCIEIPDPVNT